MDDQIFETAVQLAIETRRIAEEKRLVISKESSGYGGTYYVLRDYKGKVLAKIARGYLQAKSLRSTFPEVTYSSSQE